VLDPRIYVLDNGELFPFLHSTPVFPEWPFAATDTVHRDVAEEVQDALIKLQKYLQVGANMRNCQTDLCAVGNCSNSSSPVICDTAPPEFFDPDSPCDTTRELAELAYSAAVAGAHTGFRSARSYFDLSTMLQGAGFLKQDDKGKCKCGKTTNHYVPAGCNVGLTILGVESLLLAVGQWQCTRAQNLVSTMCKLVHSCPNSRDTSHTYSCACFFAVRRHIMP
jgi:hypothetical protein